MITPDVELTREHMKRYDAAVPGSKNPSEFIRVASIEAFKSSKDLVAYIYGWQEKALRLGMYPTMSVKVDDESVYVTRFVYEAPISH